MAREGEGYRLLVRPPRVPRALRAIVPLRCARTSLKNLNKYNFVLVVIMENVGIGVTKEKVGATQIKLIVILKMIFALQLKHALLK